MTKIKLEIVCENLESALIAQRAGADRVELCEDLKVGGVTPNVSLIESVRNKLSIALHVMIRPRGGNFLYSPEEIEIMKRSIRTCKQLNAEGVVFGLLNADGSVDKTNTKELTMLAHPMSVTFHRAFDEAADPLKSLEDIIECDCHRILTSGQKPTAMEGADLIEELIRKAQNRIIIFPGGGVRPANAAAIAMKTKANEIHSSAKPTQAGSIVDESMIRDLKAAIS